MRLKKQLSLVDPMKYVLLVALVFVACSQKPTREENTTTQVVHDTVMPPPIEPPNGNCPDLLRTEMIEILRKNVPEITQLGEPYVKRTVGDKGEFTYSFMRCPVKGVNSPSPPFE